MNLKNRLKRLEANRPATLEGLLELMTRGEVTDEYLDRMPEEDLAWIIHRTG